LSFLTFFPGWFFAVLNAATAKEAERIVQVRENRLELFDIGSDKNLNVFPVLLLASPVSATRPCSSKKPVVQVRRSLVSWAAPMGL
jgi:hypothetical protein